MSDSQKPVDLNTVRKKEKYMDDVGREILCLLKLGETEVDIFLGIGETVLPQKGPDGRLTRGPNGQLVGKPCSVQFRIEAKDIEGAFLNYDVDFKRHLDKLKKHIDDQQKAEQKEQRTALVGPNGQTIPFKK